MGCYNSTEKKEPTEGGTSPRHPSVVGGGNDVAPPRSSVSETCTPDEAPARPPVRRNSQLAHHPAPHVPSPAPEPGSPTALRRSDLMVNQSLHRVEGLGEETLRGPGFRGRFTAEKVYRCFDEGNGLLFRLVDPAQHKWAFYNDTNEYEMRVAVTFGHESVITPLGQTRKVVLNEETGSCRLEARVLPGETVEFMRGEYNGFKTVYEGIPME